MTDHPDIADQPDLEQDDFGIDPFADTPGDPYYDRYMQTTIVDDGITEYPFHVRRGEVTYHMTREEWVHWFLTGEWPTP